MSAVVVTGTDTGIGKTLVTAALAAALTERHVRLGVAKPVETGCPRIDGVLRPDDAETLVAAARSAEDLDVVCPHRFTDPLAPLAAATRAAVSIDVAALVASLAARARRFDLLLVEGAGGLLVPLTDAATWADVAQALGAPVLLVVGSRLGAINHALLSLEVLTRRRIPLTGYVVNRLAPDGDLAVETNTALLRSLTDARFLGELPFLGDAAERMRAVRAGDAAARSALAALAEAHLDVEALAGAHP